MFLNKVICIGRVATDLDSKFTPNGKKVVTFRMAVGSTRKDAEGKYKSDFVTVELWNEQGDQAEQRLQKGTRILFEGSFKVDTWKDKESGQNREKMVFTGGFRTMDKAATSEEAEG